MMVALTAIVSVSPVHAGDWYDRSETRSVPVQDVARIDFTNFDFTRLEYHGDDAATEITIQITYRVHARGPEAAEDVFDRFSLDIERSGDNLAITLDHPKQHSTNVFSMLLRRTWKEWKAEMTITGPVDADMRFGGDFSDMDIRNTAGELMLRNDFSDVRVHDHKGLLDASVSFGSLRADRIIGQFDIACEFGNTELEVAELTRDSELQVEFGDGVIHLPADAGISISSSRSFGGVDVHMEQPVFIEHKKSTFTLNGGGVPLQLGVEFANITITDQGSMDMSMR